MVHAIPWYVMVFESIPEAFLIIILGFALFDYPISFSKALVVSILSAVTTFFIRQLPLIFGIHTIIAMIILILICTWFFRINPWKAAISVVAGMAVLCILQSVMTPVLFYLTATSLDDVLLNPWLNVFFFLPQAVIMIIIYWLIKKWGFNFKLEDR